MKLDLACGGCCKPGFEGMDIAPLPGVKHVANVLEFPWPFADGSVDEIHCSHFVEHVPMAFWTPNPRHPIGREITAIQEGPHSVELLMKFFDEVHRVLKPGGIATIYSPQAHNDRAFQDPSHRRFLVPASYLYLDREWRRANGLEHAAYAISCDFKMCDVPGQTAERAALPKCRVNYTAADEGELNLARTRHPEAILAETRSYWNAAGDLVAVLEKAPAGGSAKARVPELSAAGA